LKKAPQAQRCLRSVVSLQHAIRFVITLFPFPQKKNLVLAKLSSSTSLDIFNRTGRNISKRALRFFEKRAILLL